MIVVTGASGVLGSALLNELSQQHSDVLGLTSGDLDLTDTDATLTFLRERRPKKIFHAAGRVHGLMGNRQFPCDIYTQNIRINTNVVDAAMQAGCDKFVGVSTVAAYPDTVAFPAQEDSLWNGAPHASERSYAHAKRAMYAHLDACKSQYGMDFIYPIVTNLYGPRDKFDEVNGHVVPSLVSKFFRAAASGQPATIWGTGRARRDFMYAADAAAAIVRATETLSGAVNIVSGETVPIRKVVDILSAVSGVRDVRWDGSKPDGQIDRSFDTTRLAATGFKRKYPLDEGLRLTYEWYGDNHPNVRS